jgi:large subunit ribosomal protein L18
MDNAKKRRDRARRTRVLRVRKKLRGTATRPRLSISKTNAHLYAQLIDDEKGVTLAGIGTLSKGHSLGNKKSKEAARSIGQHMAVLAKQLHISAVLFDRGRFQYHGHVAEFAAGAREAGLQF